MKKVANIIESKRELAHFLLICERDELTANELDILSFLMKDNDIQKLLEDNLKRVSR